MTPSSTVEDLVVEDALTVVLGRAQEALTHLTASATAAEVLDRCRLAEASLAPGKLRRAVWEGLPSRVKSIDDAQDAARILAAFVDEHVTSEFWTRAGTEVVAGCLLAAAVGRRPSDEIARWLTEETLLEPVEILQRAHTPVSQQLAQIDTLPSNTRSEIFWYARIAIAPWAGGGRGDR